MNTFKVGDEVLVKGKIDAISPESGNPWINFEDWHLYLSENCIHSLVKASTAIPEGWTPVSTSPEDDNRMSYHSMRNLCLLRAEGTQGYGWLIRHESNDWKWFGTVYSPEMIRAGE